MGSNTQGAASHERYQMIPRTLSFITSQDRVLLLKGAPTKRLWPNKYNGIGGHVERGESIYDAALREIHEETGIRSLGNLSLRGLIAVDTGPTTPGILVFVFTAQTDQQDVVASDEGTLEWVDWRALPIEDLLEDLPVLLPRILDAESRQNTYQPFFAYYHYDEQGELVISFSGNGADYEPSGNQN